MQYAADYINILEPICCYFYIIIPYIIIYYTVVA